MPSSRSISAVAIACALVAGVLVVGSAPVSAADPVAVINGEGWGHGVGLSQYGAQARAQAGQSATFIVQSYYAGSEIEPITAALPYPQNLWVGLKQGASIVEFEAVGGPLQLCQDGDGEGPCPKPSAVPQEGERWRLGVVGSNTCQFSVLSGGTWVPKGNAGSCNASVTRSTPDSVARVFDVISGVDWRANRGTIRIRAPHPAATSFHVSLDIGLEEYLYGIDEVPSSWEPAALEAQALAARSYALFKAKANTDENSALSTARQSLCWCHLYTDTRDQFYVGQRKEDKDTGRWRGAVDATAGIIITHPAAGLTVVSANYSASNGGYSENNEDVWGGSPAPYLRAVPDQWSLDGLPASISPWTKSFTRTELEAKTGIHRLTSARVVERTVPANSVKKVEFRGIDAAGAPVVVTKTGWQTRNLLGLRSHDFTLDVAFPLGTTDAGADSVGLHDPTTGVWELLGEAGNTKGFYYGNPADIPYAGDWNGDGVTTLGLYRTSTGFLFLRNLNTQGIADVNIYYGNPGDLPVAGDWNGDGTDTVGIFRPLEAMVYLRNTNTQGVGDISYPFGQAGDVPIAGDWNGDGRDSVALWRPSTNEVFFDNDLDGLADLTFDYAGAEPTDRIVAGDWNDDGIDTIGVYRPADTTFYLRDILNSDPANRAPIVMGEAQMSPVAGSWGF